MCACVWDAEEYFNVLLLPVVLSPGNIYCAVQNGVVIPEVSSLPLVTMASSKQGVTLFLLFSVTQTSKYGWGSTVAQPTSGLSLYPCFFNCFSQLNLLSLFHAPQPILVPSPLQRWSPWLTLNTSYCLCTLRSILGKTGSGEKMTMTTPNWPSKTFLWLQY